MNWYEEFDQVMGMQLPELEVRRDEPMREHTTFRIGGGARRMAIPRGAEEAAALLSLAQAHGWPVLAVGNGSNLLVSDDGLDRLVLLTTQMDAVQINGENGVAVAEAGIRLSRLAVAAMEHGLGGLAFAHGIPGTLGGAVMMNAGAYGGEMCQVVRRVTAWLPGCGVCTIPAEELEFGYRHSRFSGGEGVVLSAELALQPGCCREEIRREMDELIARRRASQPLEMPSAGSTFKRPVGHYAGTLIDQCGLKGLRVGGAQVSEKHAGFIVNCGDATCRDVTALIGEVQRRVKEATGVDLEPEVRVMR